MVVVTLQYRPLSSGRVSPYVGAGINYMLFYSGKDKNGFTVDLDDGFGYALQAGADADRADFECAGDVGGRAEPRCRKRKPPDGGATCT